MSNLALPMISGLALPRARLTPALTGLLLGLGAALIWGTYLAMARAGVSAGLHGADVAFLRYAVAGLVLLPWLVRHQPASLAGIGWGRAAVLVALSARPSS